MDKYLKHFASRSSNARPSIPHGNVNPHSPRSNQADMVKYRHTLRIVCTACFVSAAHVPHTHSARPIRTQDGGIRLVTVRPEGVIFHPKHVAVTAPPSTKHSTTLQPAPPDITRYVPPLLHTSYQPACRDQTSFCPHKPPVIDFVHVSRSKYVSELSWQ